MKSCISRTDITLNWLEKIVLGIVRLLFVAPGMKYMLKVTLFFLWAACAYANLLQNSDLVVNEKGTLQEWYFKPGNLPVAAQKGVGEEGGSRHLYVKSSAASLHGWWGQEIAVSGGDSYTLGWEAKATGGEEYDAFVGVEFLDASRKWISYANLKTVARNSAKWLSANVPPVKDWQKFEAKFTVPATAVYVRLRLGLGSESAAEAYFRKIALEKTSSSVSEILAQAPGEIPRFSFPLQEVEANGVKLLPDWSSKEAEFTRSPSRWRLCLNGLWAIQPAEGLPKEGDWAFFKVPGYFNRKLYSIYGLKSTSWASRNIYQGGEPLWYLRDVHVPVRETRATPAPEGGWVQQWKRALGETKPVPVVSSPESIFLEIRGMWGYAVRVYWNGKLVGELENQLGGRLDLTGKAQPGETGQLAIYALGVMPADPRETYKPNFQRKRVPPRFGGDWSKGFHDIYLVSEPRDALIRDVRLSPMVSTGELSVHFSAPVSPYNLQYRIKIHDAEGKVVVEKSLSDLKREGSAISSRIRWKEAKLWTPDTPTLYSASIQGLDSKGQLRDETLPIRFGFREVKIVGKNLTLNGTPLRLRPRLIPGFGYMDSSSIRKLFSFLKDMGFNTVLRPCAGGIEEDDNRMPTESFYSIADEMGMMVIAYTPYRIVSGGQFAGETIEASELEDLVRFVDKYLIARIQHHPSLIAWSGFGNSPSVRGNPLMNDPEVWGQKKINLPVDLEDFIKDGGERDKISARLEGGRRFVEKIKERDPSRPFLSHLDVGQSDGWGAFDYFNWTPVQEWEEWPKRWFEKGIMPIGSTEHGLPYPASFVNHAPAGSDMEPWATEYAAAELGMHAYRNETVDYVKYIGEVYDPVVRTYTRGIQSSFHAAGNATVRRASENVQAIWAERNKLIYRTWRTYGVPMGLEPFGPSDNYLKDDGPSRGDGTVVANKSLNLQTIGPKQDLWNHRGYWPYELVYSYPETPTGRKPDILLPMGEALHANNSPFLAYIAGARGEFEKKDHVFWSGERVEKQIVLIWDGFSPKSVAVSWKARVSGQEIGSGSFDCALNPGEIRFVSIAFDAPPVDGRAEGKIELSVRSDKKNNPVVQDHFAFQIYSRDVFGDSVTSARLASFDPSGQSAEMFARMGLHPERVTELDKVPPCDLLILGRKALESVKDFRWLKSLPSGVPVLILEQTDKSLERIGFRTFPMRSRQAHNLLQPSSLTQGVEDAELKNWRISPTLLPSGTAALRDGYNYHNGYVGTVASVTIETPTRGNFSPHLQNGFDLRETALLETKYQGHPILFCQLSLPDGVGIDPVATRLFKNIVTNLVARRAENLSPLIILGNKETESLARELGALGVEAALSASANRVALIDIVPSETKSLSHWVQAGGTALLMPQELDIYRKLFPELSITERKLSLIPGEKIPKEPLLKGLGQNDFHYRKALSQLVFDEGANVKEIASGKGKWVLIGFDPRKLDLKNEPYLRLTLRHQYRVLSQILSNLGADLPVPFTNMVESLGTSQGRLSLTETGNFRIAAAGSVDAQAWKTPDFDDGGWAELDPRSKSTSFGKAWIRVKIPDMSKGQATPLVLDLGTIDDFDETWLNGVKIGSTTPENTNPEKAYSVHRVYPIPQGLLRDQGANVLAISAWNRNAESKGWNVWLRGPILIRPAHDGEGPYVGGYKYTDDPYLQYHW